MLRTRVLYLLPLLLLAGLLPHGAVVPVIPAAHFIVGEASIMAPSVNLVNNTGQLTQISLTVTRGGGVVTIIGPAYIANNTQQSAESAAAYASQYLGVNFSDYNFIYSISDLNANVSGPSAGAAMTMLAISAISGTHLISNFTITGTINNGTIGTIGGVYDKSGAAAQAGMKFILVPQSSQQNELYYLVQGRFGIPLVQVPNITTALQYAFGKKSIANQSTTIDLYTDFQVPLVRQANISCSNGCSMAPFAALVNYTISSTAAQISEVPSSSYPSAAAQMQQELSQSKSINSRGYLYVAADTSFLNYINAYFLSSGNTTVSSGLATLNQVYNYCSTLAPPQLTAQNYEWVVQGELRQSWGAYTVAAQVNAYNNSFDTDEVLSSLYSAGESQAWCHAANYMYGLASSVGGASASASSNLTLIAQSRISRAGAFGSNMYLQTAQDAYSNYNYPLAIVDADYAYAGGFSGLSASLNASELNSMALAIAANSTYGVWATQYANQAAFYAQESQVSSNASVAQGYAMQAYSSAVLAQQMSNDSMVIYKSLAPMATTTTISQTRTGSLFDMSALGELMYIIIAIVIIILIVDLVILLKISALMKGAKTKRSSQARRRRR